MFLFTHSLTQACSWEILISPCWWFILLSFAFWVPGPTRWKYLGDSGFETCPSFHYAQARRPGNALTLSDGGNLRFPCESVYPSSTARSYKDSMQMPRGVKITWPLIGAVCAPCDCITPNCDDNHFTASDSLGLPCKQHSVSWLVSAPCGVSLGGSSMNEGSKMASPPCLAVDAACHMGSLISPLHQLSSSRASLCPWSLLARYPRLPYMIPGFWEGRSKNCRPLQALAQKSYSLTCAPSCWSKQVREPAPIWEDFFHRLHLFFIDFISHWEEWKVYTVIGRIVGSHPGKQFIAEARIFKQPFSFPCIVKFSTGFSSKATQGPFSI